jgi:Tfp pilus assembly protein PilO
MIAKMNRLAQTAGVNVTYTEPKEPKEIDFYRELQIEIRFEGDIGSVVRFLYSLMSDAGILDLRQLTIRPKQGSDEDLSCSADVYSVFVTESRRGTREPSEST